MVTRKYINFDSIYHNNIFHFIQSISNDANEDGGDNAVAEAYQADNQFKGTRHYGMINSKRHLDQSHMYRAQKGR